MLIFGVDVDVKIDKVGRAGGTVFDVLGILGYQPFRRLIREGVTGYLNNRSRRLLWG